MSSRQFEQFIIVMIIRQELGQTYYTLNSKKIQKGFIVDGWDRRC